MISNMRQLSLAVHGGSIFNMLPGYIRIFKGSMDKFMKHLDDFLRQIPGMYPEPVSRSKNLNALIDWIYFLGLRERRLDINGDIFV